MAAHSFSVPRSWIRGVLLAFGPDCDLAIKCSHAHLVLIPNPAHNQNGGFGLLGGHITHDENPSDKLPRYTFSGISVYHPRFFARVPSGRYSVVPMLIATAALKHVTGEIYRSDWHDIGTLERLEALRKTKT